MKIFKKKQDKKLVDFSYICHNKKKNMLTKGVEEGLSLYLTDNEVKTIANFLYDLRFNRYDIIDINSITINGIKIKDLDYIHIPDRL